MRQWPVSNSLRKKPKHRVHLITNSFPSERNPSTRRRIQPHAPTPQASRRNTLFSFGFVRRRVHATKRTRTASPRQPFVDAELMIHMTTLQTHTGLLGRERLQTDRAFPRLRFRFSRAHWKETHLPLRRCANLLLPPRHRLARGQDVLDDSSADSPEEEDNHRLCNS